jgi:GPI mannosyltransferase 3
VALRVLVAHKEARFLFPLAILATSFPVLGFASFSPIWAWRDGWAAKAITALSLIFMAYLALYPFGVRPHMPMAQFLYRHPPGMVASLTPVFESYPLYKPTDYRPVRMTSAQFDAALARGPVLLMSQTPTLPPGIHANATLLYSEFLFAEGHAQAGTDYIAGYTVFANRARFLKLLPLYWYTLYRVERSAAIRS